MFKILKKNHQRAYCSFTDKQFKEILETYNDGVLLNKFFEKVAHLEVDIDKSTKHELFCVAIINYFFANKEQTCVLIELILFNDLSH